MRVVFLTHNYPRWPGDFSGAALAALARALVRRGVSVRVVAPTEDGGGKAELDGVTVNRVRVGSSLGAALADPPAFAARLRTPLGWTSLVRLWRILKPVARREIGQGADLVHAHWWIPAGLAAPPGVPVVVTVQGTDAALLRTSRLARGLARPLFRRAAVVTAVSRQSAELVQSLTGRFVGAERIHPLPIDSRGHSWTRGGGGIVLISRLARGDRVELALETVAVLASCGHDLPLTIIGDGPDRDSLEQRGRRLGVSALVRFVGPMPLDQARTHLARADVLLFTARGDGMAVPVLEALISGVPVVACWDSGAAVDIVPESGAGRLTLPSADALAESVASLQADRQRLAVGRLVGEAWRARLAPDYVAQLCEEWYRNALAG